MTNIIHSLTVSEIRNILIEGKQEQAFVAGHILEVLSDAKKAVYRAKILGVNHDVDINGKIIPLTVAPLEMPFRKAMHEDWRKSVGDYSKTEVRAHLNGAFYDSLPDEVKQLIVPSVKRTKNYDGIVSVTIDKIFIPSEYEVFGKTVYSNRADEDKQYELFKDWRQRFQALEGQEEGYPYWLRSPRSGSTNGFCGVGSDGAYGNCDAGAALAVLPCFCIGVSE